MCWGRLLPIVSCSPHDQDPLLDPRRNANPPPRSGLEGLTLKSIPRERSWRDAREFRAQDELAQPVPKRAVLWHLPPSTRYGLPVIDTWSIRIVGRIRLNSESLSELIPEILASASNRLPEISVPATGRSSFPLRIR